MLIGIYSPKLKITDRAEVEVALAEARSLGGLCVQGLNLQNLKAAGAHLVGARFSGCDLRAADFSGADLRGVWFDDAQLEKAVAEKSKKVQEGMAPLPSS